MGLDEYTDTLRDRQLLCRVAACLSTDDMRALLDLNARETASAIMRAFTVIKTDQGEVTASQITAPPGQQPQEQVDPSLAARADRLLCSTGFQASVGALAVFMPAARMALVAVEAYCHGSGLLSAALNALRELVGFAPTSLETGGQPRQLPAPGAGSAYQPGFNTRAQPQDPAVLAVKGALAYVVGASPRAARSGEVVRTKYSTLFDTVDDEQVVAAGLLDPLVNQNLPLPPVGETPQETVAFWTAMAALATADSQTIGEDLSLMSVSKADPDNTGDNDDLNDLLDATVTEGELIIAASELWARALT